ncbi:MAG: hypothetical protein RBU37_13610, partial [Myxococcota bacterium]|nr:hypothetical protein [Myxococcota bacterium]
DTKVHLSLELERYDWSADAGSELKLHKSTLPMLLTLTRIDGVWKVTEANREWEFPGGALRSLLD